MISTEKRKQGTFIPSCPFRTFVYRLSLTLPLQRGKKVKISDSLEINSLGSLPLKSSLLPRRSPFSTSRKPRVLRTLIVILPVSFFTK